MSGTFPLYGSAAARQLDARATALLGGDGYQLMQRAGQAGWRYLLQQWPQAQRIVVVCGPGNNGGDGYVLARLARRSGRSVQLVHLREHVPASELAQRACTDYLAAGGTVELFDERLPAADVVVDALFGIGLTRPPDAGCAALIAAINAQSVPVLSLDVPSGVDAELGSVPGAAVLATCTLQFIAMHAGLFTGDALEYTGALALDDLDVPAAAFDDTAAAATLLQKDALARWLLPRRRNTHKGESGRVLCIGGDHGSGGAIALCAEAALRCGAGLLSVATRESHVAALLARRPEAMVRAVESGEALQALLEPADIVALGPGLGQGDWAQGLFALALRAGKPLVIDADALNLLAAQPHKLDDAVLTPHPGEAARLLGVGGAADVQRDRFAAARALSERYGSVVVLKGAGTVVAAPGQIPRAIDAGNPGMAVGGMGDALTGVIAALRGQGLPAFDAASAGALLHALAGDEAASEGERGLLPSDLMPHLRRLANP
ncbi:NAD(P)H-hydrate dehydratase [Pseudoxanthomonas wuyuanensis]|uniref:Bifunctional NAD(P)H-hydrate repair enzyme n=1 Tax=Pseudoxanthomonas wuyuanensis TaxID=1073196 RepID=A0A286D9B9_9GAMM|nr:NAD(P)H-hydrate dehydratase [Pseudoxanthomonas wuyuanensis]KAF1722038.1 bifunctional ADP-dependent NAD(P)H-hydrate dehydratase/NAD(P)H-hydrate epimerase [Pseudoxanthomonas wuyuanensis]SOD55223.1 NAD(P)H-hydrate epimerase [Pseudoxanthomonas wuyuanensis]